MLLITFCSYFCSFSGQIPHYLQSDSNTMNPGRIRRCMIKPKEIWSKNAEEKEGTVEIWQGSKNSQPANFVTLLPSLNAFLLSLFGFVQICPLCNFGSFIHFCNFLSTEHLYELSQACNINQLSVHQSINKIGRQVSSPSAGV